MRTRAPASAWLALLALALPGCLNFGVVEAGKVYRSSQPDAEDLRELRESPGILSVLNLRGRMPNESWWREEERACREIGITLFDVQWPSTSWPEQDAVLEVLDVFEEAPYPLLIHCRAGADRTGLASALYLIAKHGATVREAAGQLTVWRGHFGWITGTGEMDSFLDLYENRSNGKELRAWVAQDYGRERARILEDGIDP